jgi:transposase
MRKLAPTPRTLADALAVLDVVCAEVVGLRAENAQLRARVQELEARLGQNSTNSSRPPSSDPPETPPRPPAPPSGRRRGGQPGHAPQQRAFVPSEQVDQFVTHWPSHCRGCQAPLAPDAVGEPVRHQVTELPPVRAVVTEHQLQHVRCAGCGTTTCAGLPADVPAGAFGPRLQATVAVLSGRYRLSRREVVGVCTDVLSAPLAVGSVDRLCQATATALAAPVAALAQAVQQAPSAHADETGWREAGQRRWLWVVVTAMATVFTLAPSRGSVVIQGLLGATFAGYLITDRWSAYTWLAPARRQVCWAHLKRDFQKLVDYGGPGRAIGQEALRLLAGLFGAWARLARRPHPAAAIRTARAPVSMALPPARGDRAAEPVRQDGQLLHRPAQALAGLVDLRHHPGHRADEQRGGAGDPAGRALAQGQLRHPERRRQLLRRTPPVRRGHLPPAGSLPARLPHGRLHRRPGR